ncbi:MAG: efflux RND transporter periplasmic adaptor subunit [Ignavibacteriales bacterium]|nr:efflux RND transporter periplasmic adaptor subunit [Ignavibacteriales bacterium]
MKYIFSITLITCIIMSGCGKNDGATISSTGTIEATDVVISAQAGGVVQRLFVEEGTAVQTGDTLLVINDVDWRFQYEQSAAGFDMAEAQFQLAVKGSRAEDIAQAEANYRNAEADRKRIEELWQTKSVTDKQLDDARMRFTVAEQTREKLKRGSRPEEITLARARRDQAKAQMKSLRKKLDDCIVRAPMNGVVTKRFVETGELVGSGSSLIRLDDLSDMDITIYVSETELPKVVLGQKASISVDAFPNRNFEGQVVFISPTAEFTPKNIQTNEERTKLVFGVKIKVPNSDGVLKAGIPADVTLDVAKP